jgi:uncharacterized protein (DUF885 family)
MDQELISFLDERFRQATRDFAALLREEIAALRQEMSREIAGLRQEMSGGIAGLRQEMSGEIAGLRQETDQRFARIDREFAEVKDGIRQTQVMVEASRGDIKLLAEGIIGEGEKLQAFRGEVALLLDEVKGAIFPYYRSIEHRVRQLEERAAREGQDPLELIRQRFGKPSSSV